jgi:hypothetical protein
MARIQVSVRFKQILSLGFFVPFVPFAAIPSYLSADGLSSLISSGTPVPEITDY